METIGLPLQMFPAIRELVRSGWLTIAAKSKACATFGSRGTWPNERKSGDLMILLQNTSKLIRMFPTYR